MSGRSTQTPRLGLYKPDPGGDVDVWGDELNRNADILDNALLAGVAASLYLPLAGGAMTGPLGLAGPPTVPIATPTINAGSLTLDFRTGGVFRVLLNSNITALALASYAPGKATTCQLELLGDGTPRTVDFGVWTVATGAPVPTFAVGRKDIYDIRTDGTNVVVWLTAMNVPA